MSEGGRRVVAISFAAFLVMLSIGTVSGHEQETYNVIVVADGPMPANITDSDFVQGNAVVFRMKDTTENASIRITLDSDLSGAFDNQSDNQSDWLVYACELTDNGTLADEDCSVSFTYEFATNATPGTYAYQLEAFLAATKGKESNLTSAEDGLKQMQLIDAVYARGGLRPRGEGKTHIGPSV